MNALVVLLSGELKFAVLMKSIGGQLKTYLNMTIQDSTTYETLRESILQYDQATIKWSNTMALGTSMQSNDGPAPMDVDRIWKGKGKGKDKGKSDRPKGDGKGWKGKGKGEKGGKNQKGSWNANGSWGQGKSSWNQNGNQNTNSFSDKSGKPSKGKGKFGKSKDGCWKCGKAGHMAKECRVRFVEESGDVNCENEATGSTSNATNTAATNNSGRVNRVSIHELASASSSTPSHFFDLSVCSDFSRLSVNMVSEMMETCSQLISHEHGAFCEPEGNDFDSSLHGSYDAGDVRLSRSSRSDECLHYVSTSSIDECICSSINSAEFIPCNDSTACCGYELCTLCKLDDFDHFPTLFLLMVASLCMSEFNHDEVQGV